MNKRSFLSGLFVCTLLISLVSATCHARDATSFDPRKIHVEAVNVGGGVPIGTIVAWPVATNPSDWEKWLECNGQAIDAAVYPELRALIGATVPDLRGLFLRGFGSQGHLQWNGNIIGNTWTTHSSGALRQIQGDATRHLWGSNLDVSGCPHGNASFAGAMQHHVGQRIGFAYRSGPSEGVSLYGTTTMDNALLMPIAAEMRPVNVAVRYLIRASQ